jgi:hypothetical protein
METPVRRLLVVLTATAAATLAFATPAAACITPTVAGLNTVQVCIGVD